jgi:hypothetical protein
MVSNPAKTGEEEQVVARAARWLELNYEMRDHHPGEWFAIVDDESYHSPDREQLERTLLAAGSDPRNIYIRFSSPRGVHEREQSNRDRIRTLERSITLLDEAIAKHQGEWYAIVAGHLFHGEEPMIVRSLLLQIGVNPADIPICRVPTPVPHLV